MSKKELLMATAIRLFVTKGFDNVSTAEIAKASGVATGTLFNYFATKEELIIACYQQAKQSFIAQTMPYLSEVSTQQALYSMWVGLIDWSLVHQDWFYYMQQFRHSAYYRKDLIADDTGWHVLLGWWKKAISDQLLKDVPLDLLLSLFTGLLYSTIDYIISQNDKMAIAASFSLCWDMIKRE